MPLINQDEQFPITPVIVMIVGTPFSYKSSLAMTANNAILIDGDRGAQRAVRNCPVLQVKNWDEVRAENDNGLFKDKRTVILDTPKSLLEDFIWDWCQRQKYQADDRKVYGAIATEFKSFTSQRRLEGADLVIVSHEKSSEKKGGTVYEPDITGATKQLLLRMCDQVGFIEKREIKGPNSKNTIQTVLTFNPTPEWPFCKNVAQLEDIIIPAYTSPEWKTFMDTHIIQPTKNAMSKMTEEQKGALDLIADWRLTIDLLVYDNNDEKLQAEITSTYSEIAKLTPEHLKKQISTYFLAHLKKIGWKWDKTANEGKGAFVNTKAVVAEIKPAEQPKVDEPVNTPAVEESNPAALTEGKEDLFAPETK